MPTPALHPFLQADLRYPSGPPRRICRLGLASRGDSQLTPGDIEYALAAGVDFLNWCGTPDALSASIAGLGRRRSAVVICVQFEARTAAEARMELDRIVQQLGTDCVDVLTFYYVEATEEWDEIAGPGGALEFCIEARKAGRVRLLGLTSHQRPLAAAIARSGTLDLLMIRYNAAHRGAEQDVFPTTTALGMPVVAYTSLRWGALLHGTPDDPPGFVPLRAPAWYRFVLQNQAVTVALTAPATRAELEEDLEVLGATGPLPPEEHERLAEHGRRVHRHGGSFP
jgi:predicted aldo/keto reductase-like oxidoreductase